jgi:hypothetical protein
MALAWSFMQVGEMGTRPHVLLGDLWQETIRAFVHPDYVQDSHLHLLYFARTPDEAVTHIKNVLHGA